MYSVYEQGVCRVLKSLKTPFEALNCLFEVFNTVSTGLK